MASDAAAPASWPARTCDRLRRSPVAGPLDRELHGALGALRTADELGQGSTLRAWLPMQGLKCPLALP